MRLNLRTRTKKDESGVTSKRYKKTGAGKRGSDVTWSDSRSFRARTRLPWNTPGCVREIEIESVSKGWG